MANQFDPWPVEDTEKLRKMRLGGASASTIAKELGKTRSSVVAKARRLGLASSFVSPPPKPRNRRKPVAPMPMPVVPPSRHPVPFLKTKPHHCRAILDDRDDDGVLVCGDRKTAGSSYCLHHRDLYVQPPEPRKERQPQWPSQQR